MSSSPSSLASAAQPLITDSRVLASIADSHIQGPSACFVTDADRVIAVNQLALQVLGKDKEDVVEHLASEFDGNSVIKGALLRVSTPLPSGEGVDMLDAGLVVKIVPIEGTPLKVYWLRGVSSKESRSSGELELSRVNSSSMLSPRSLRGSPPIKRLASVENHLAGNALTRVLEGQSDTIQLVAMQAYEVHKQIREDVGFAETLELNHGEIERTGTGFVSADESVDNIKHILKKMFIEGGLNPHIPKVVLTTTSLDALDQNYSVDWKRVSYVISQLFQNACEHGGNEVRIILDIEYDESSEMLKIFIQDNGPGMDSVYLREALDGITFTEGATAPTSNPGIILRICRLLVEDVLNGQFIAKTNSSGTAFELSMKVKSMLPERDVGRSSSFRSVAIETGDIDFKGIAGAGRGSEPSPVIHCKHGAFKRVPSLFRIEDFITFDPPQALMSGRGRREGYFQLPGLESNLVSLETILRLDSFKEGAEVVTNLDALLADSIKLSLDAPILHVDDERSGQRMIAGFMKQCNLTSTEVADSGASALEKVQRAIAAGTPYQMIFMDQMLGGEVAELDKGNKVAERIFQIYRDSGLPSPIIIPASGNMSEEDLAIYRASGMSCELCLEKPYGLPQMKKIVEKYFTAS